MQMRYEYGKNAHVVQEDNHTITVNVEGGQWIIGKGLIYKSGRRDAHFFPDGYGLNFTRVRAVELTENGFIVCQ